MAESSVRVRFCPSPTGNPHVGMVRTALFNWAFARHTGGTFVFRIEDTDSARDSEESYEALLEALGWLGLTWDEGPVVGGPYGPYRQSQRMQDGIYADVATRLESAGFAYRCYCTPEELEERRELARAEHRAPGYDGHCRKLEAEQVADYQAQGRPSVLRFRMPDRDSTWDDLVRGPITFAADQVPDYVLVRANGEPLYTLVNPVDDALMRITHVLRGEDLLSSTPRQLALYEALAAIGVSDGTTPAFGHLPYVMGEGNKKLSKRDPESSLQWYRDEGYLPEALLNYLSLLGWSMGEDREFFSKEELAAAFTLDRVSPNPARFDLKKCTAINGDWIRTLDTGELAERIVPYLVSAGIVTEPIAPDTRRVLDEAVPLVQERMETLGQSVGMLGFLLVDEQEFARDKADVAAVLDDQGRGVVRAALEALDSLPEWTAAGIESALRAALIDEMGLKPKVAFGPVRVAVTGRRVSPPLFESMEILGRERSLGRLRSAL
ncbi:MAG TPA: glutamate--tRNA ligase [Actinobacteria bacterium]|nr:glutamate--tRNA ligase [Actinomycetota bacterium]